jgi:hypothetical protein
MMRLPKALSLEKSILEIQGYWLNGLTGYGPEALLPQLLERSMDQITISFLKNLPVKALCGKRLSVRGPLPYYCMLLFGVE